MALLNDLGETLFEGGGVTGTLVVAGGLMLAPLVGRALRPVAKELIKDGYVLAHKAREVAADTGERWGDLVAEAREELDTEQSRA
jgi:hypothetical protein